MSKQKAREVTAEEKIAAAEIIPLLPCAFGRNESFPRELIGSTILGFGVLKTATHGVSPESRDGGLTIDYRLASGQCRRLVLEFTELGMWVSCTIDITPSSTPGGDEG